MDAELQHVKAELARCRKQLWRETQGIERWGLSKRMMQTAVWIYVQSNYSLNTASEYAKQMQKKRRKLLLGIQAKLPSEPPISHWFVTMPLQELLSLEDNEYVVQNAAEFLAEHCAATWVHEVNTTLGVAPSNTAVFQKYASKCAVTAALRASASGRDSGRLRRCWMMKFRKKWKLSVRCLRPVPNCSAADIHNKVGVPVIFLLKCSNSLQLS